MNLAPNEPQPVQARLGFWDAVSIIIGIIIGATIYETPPLIYQNVSGVGWALGVWVLGGILSLLGAFCYAELATTYPRSGGDYNYLTRAFGSWMGFVFAWAQLTVIHTGGIGMLAYIFADYTHRLFWGKTDEGKEFAFLFAALSVVVLTAMNLAGIVLGKRTQNVLTAAKVLGLTGILIGGFLFAQPPKREYTQGQVVRIDPGQRQLTVAIQPDVERTYQVHPEVVISAAFDKSKLPKLPEGEKHELKDIPKDLAVTVIAETTEPDRILRIEEWAAPNFGLAMVLVFLAFSGYNDAAYVAAEVRNRRRNLPLALTLGVISVTLIYLAINAAYLLGLGLGDARRSDAVAADALGLFLGTNGEKAMCLLVMISALGAINGSILTGSRIFATLGADHRVFGWLGSWNVRSGTPVAAMITMALICLVMIVGVGTEAGQKALDQLFTAVGLEKLSWAGRGGFGTLLKLTTPIFWLFYLLTSLSLFVLRERDRQIERPFSAPLYPLLPLIFTGTCIIMLHSGISYAGNLGLVGIALLLVGLLLYGLSNLGAVKEERPADVLPPATDERITGQPPMAGEEPITDKPFA